MPYKPTQCFDLYLGEEYLGSIYGEELLSTSGCTGIKASDRGFGFCFIMTDNTMKRLGISIKEPGPGANQLLSEEEPVNVSE